MSHTAQLRAALAGRYEVESEIGAGGMATVYCARDLKHDRRVALKVLKPDLAVQGSSWPCSSRALYLSATRAVRRTRIDWLYRG